VLLRTAGTRKPQETIITYSMTATGRVADLSASSGPSPLGAWLGMALQRLRARLASSRTLHDRVRELAEVRALADSVRESDPGFADDLFAAADRYEVQGM
jgi:hypothetical protein